MREHLKVFPHSPGDNRIETNNTHSMRLIIKKFKKATVVWRLVIASVKREK